MGEDLNLRGLIHSMMGNGTSSTGRKLVVAEHVGRRLGLHLSCGEPVYCVGDPWPDEMEAWLWEAIQICEAVGWQPEGVHHGD